MKSNNTVIALKKIVKNYHSGEVETKVLREITFSINAGEFIAVVGPSGSGKSTLLHIIGLLDKPSGGTYLLHGNDVTNLTEDQQAHVRNREIGFIFQSFNLLQRATVLENVMLPAIYAGTNESFREKQAKVLMEKLGLTEQMHKKPNQLSGGQQQRVAIARALENEPSIILADEPTGNLDSNSGKDVMEILKNLNKQGKTVIVITHDTTIANHTQRLITIKDGRIE